MRYRLTRKDENAIDSTVQKLARFHGSVFTSVMPRAFIRLTIHEASKKILRELHSKNGRRAKVHEADLRKAVRDYIKETLYS